MNKAVFGHAYNKNSFFRTCLLCAVVRKLLLQSAIYIRIILSHFSEVAPSIAHAKKAIARRMRRAIKDILDSCR